MGPHPVDPRASAGLRPDNGSGAVAAALRQGRLRDPVGHVVHTALAMLYLFLLPLSTAPKDIAWGILLGWTVVRLPHIWSCYRAPLRDRLMWLLFAWVAWHGLSVLWSDDWQAGLDELGAYRVVLTPLMLWPILDRVPWLLGAFLGGVFGQNLVQMAQHLEWFGMSPGPGGRLDGWLHAIQTGAFCAAAMCWHMAAVLNWRCGSYRESRGVLIASLVGLFAASAGLLFSGSRGPWISAAIAVASGLVVIALRRPATRRAALALAAVGLLGSAGAWLVAGDFIASRVNQAIADVRGAGEGEFDSDLGLRLARWSAAWSVFVESPARGVGAGGYGPAIQELEPGDLFRPDHHAHSMYLHQLATTGAPGALIILGVVLLAIWRAYRDPPDHPYADGTLFVLISWLIGAQTDCYNLNGHLFGLFGLIVALTLPHRAAIRYKLRAGDSAESQPA
ncbi:MAG: O-antigen ligase family protein [Planctomycetota bacterium]|jgi:O-antigen ligase